MMRGMLSSAASGIRIADLDSQAPCPHCRGALSIHEAAHFVGIALCPYPACGRRLVVEVTERDANGGPLEFQVRSTAGYVAAVRPLGTTRERRWIPISLLMATLTSGVLAWCGFRVATIPHLPWSKLGALLGLSVVASVSWSTVATAWAADKWMRAFLWRRGLVMEAPSARLSPGATVGGGRLP
ncbi:MAG: hypothetical protein AB2A00_18855 [Myxococcota bacterium]